MKSSIKLIGSKEGGWVIELNDSRGYKADLQLTHKEIIRLKELLSKKIK